MALDRRDGRGLERGVLASDRDSRCRRTTAAAGRCGSTQMPSVRSVSASVRRRCACSSSASFSFAKSSSDGMFAVYSTAPMDREPLVRAGPGARLAALCADEDRARRRCRSSRTQGCRIVLADGRELIDGIASWWTACHGYNHPHIRAGGRAAARDHAARDVRRAGARAGADAGAAARGAAAGRSRPGVLLASPARSRSRSR